MKLSRRDFEFWTKALITQPPSSHGFMDWITGPVKDFFPFQRIFIGHGELVAGQIKMTHWQAAGHEQRFLEHQANSFELEKRGALAWWLLNRTPLLIDPLSPPPYVTRFELDEIEEFSLENVAAHGVLNLRANAGTYFSFAGVSPPLSSWHIDALRIMAPVLNDRYLAYIADQGPPTMLLGKLTLRQRAIVRRVAEGNDDKTIAGELGIAVQTVKNQLSLVYRQLGIRKRSQLLALLR